MLTLSVSQRQSINQSNSQKKVVAFRKALVYHIFNLNADYLAFIID